MGRCTRGGTGTDEEGAAGAGAGAGMSDIELGTFMVVESRVEGWSLRVGEALIASRESVRGICWGASVATSSARGGKTLSSPSRGSK